MSTALPFESEGKEFAEDILSAYRAAAASCDGPQLPPFVRFNSLHLPSELPPRFLGVHAAFCIKDGEAPQLPDYLALSREAFCSLADLGKKPNPADGLPKPELAVASSTVKVAANGSGDFGCWGQKRLQYRALRRSIEFLKQKGYDCSLFKSPIVEYLVNNASLNATSEQDGEGAACKAAQGAELLRETEPTPPSAVVRPAALVPSSERTACTPQTAMPLTTEAVLKSSSDMKERNEELSLDNPLLEGMGDKANHISEAAAVSKPCQSNAAVLKKRKGLNTVAMRHRNLEEVSKECTGNAICLSQAACGTCEILNCGKEHDIAEFMKNRPEDLEGECVFFSRHGICPYGCCCRFGRSHLDLSGINVLRHGQPVTHADLRKYQEVRETDEVNVLDHQTKIFVRTRNRRRCRDPGRTEGGDQSTPSAKYSRADESALRPANEAEQPVAQPKKEMYTTCPSSALPVGAVVIDNDNMGQEERRRRFATQVRGKAFLAPLTTLGNLPFRRLCTRLGADVTVSEMAVAHSLVEGRPSELCLLNCGQMLNDCGIACDFIDLNIACPLDQLHRRFKAGSFMLERPAVVESVVKSLMESCPSVPVTVKVRTAHYGKKHQLHTVIGRISRSGVSAIFAHGRTAQQRYSKSADWDYLCSCRKLMPEDVLLVGCGDILSSAEYQFRQQAPEMDALMIGRGALIKPWIFTEVKEQRLWDISAVERLSIIKEFVDNGLEHWGSDRRGVATTRRFLLELLSFMHRYIPPPFLELQPQLIHWRPSPFKGRSDLEVKLSSPNPQDWVEISSMFLGPPPKGFMFVPKHASNSYYIAE